ncbi:MAG: flagellar biosynthetic protein FliQ [Hyphomicrobium sp.]|nr:flagellar biosynthetic protein FliQ [Hyphomicrobium sp.]
MNAVDANELIQLAIWVTLLISAPVVSSVMIVGLIISVLQALTQIQEVTLTFVPKIIVALLMLIATAPFMGSQVSIFAAKVYGMISSVAG